MCPFGCHWGPGPESITGQMSLLCSACFWSHLLSCMSMCDSHPHLCAVILSPLWQLHHPIYQSFNLFKIVFHTNSILFFQDFQTWPLQKHSKATAPKGRAKLKALPSRKLWLLMWRGEEEEKRRLELHRHEIELQTAPGNVLRESKL